MAAASKKGIMLSMSRYTGWRRMAAWLAILIVALTSLLITVLIVSLHAINGGGTPVLKDTIIYTGKCDTTSRTNLWLHLAINIVATGILGSSNFFMQVLVAPTRQEIDQAHATGQWVEVGVHSIRNFRFLAGRKVILWFLFSLSSVPLHLIFNGCVLESKASNGFKVLVVAESFLNGTRYEYPPVTKIEDSKSAEDERTILGIRNSATEKDTRGSWKQLSFEACMSRYNNPTNILYKHRHVIMVASNFNETSTTGWTREQVLKDATHFKDGDLINSLWYHRSFLHTDSIVKSYDSESVIPEHLFTGYISDLIWDEHRLPEADGYLDPVTGNMTLEPDRYQPTFNAVQIRDCLSESLEAPCRLSIANPLLLIVCIMCSFKCLLCIITLTNMSIWRDEDPLMTPGDAIASFIATPSSETKGMCTLSSKDFGPKAARWLDGVRGTYTNLEAPRPWNTSSKRSAGSGVPISIWFLSCLLIGGSLAVAGFLFVQAARAQSIKDSRFSHDPANLPVEGLELSRLSFIALTMLANTPQLILSICYMAVNGLVTRMLVEFEWARYSVVFHSLRVTKPVGQQRSTYRLQLPYRWSIPILTLSAFLHWVYSNCLYVSYYDFYDANWPYRIVETSRGLQYSTVAILIALLLSLAVTATPLILSAFHLPGNMVLGGSNSKVIAAACHCIPTACTNAASKSLAATLEAMVVVDGDTDAETLLAADAENSEAGNRNTDADKLKAMATQKLRWGQVSDGDDSDEVGHLAFGVEQQGVTEPVNGKLYSGYR